MNNYAGPGSTSQSCQTLVLIGHLFAGRIGSCAVASLFFVIIFKDTRTLILARGKCQDQQHCQLTHEWDNNSACWVTNDLLPIQGQVFEVAGNRLTVWSIPEEQSQCTKMIAVFF